jgi:hypothetical protein
MAERRVNMDDDAIDQALEAVSRQHGLRAPAEAPARPEPAPAAFEVPDWAPERIKNPPFKLGGATVRWPNRELYQRWHLFTWQTNTPLQAAFEEALDDYLRKHNR